MRWGTRPRAFLPIAVSTGRAACGRVVIRLDKGHPDAAIVKGNRSVALIAVAAVLALGLLNMAAGGSAQRSKRLMRWRIALQFLAIAVIMAVIYLASN